MGEEEAWIREYRGIREKIEELLGQKLEGEPLSKGKYVNPKLITWDGGIRTRFRGSYPGFIEEIGACYATGVLKIGSVYRQGSNYHLQVFLKEVKYQEREARFKSLLSDDESEDSGYDTVN